MTDIDVSLEFTPNPNTLKFVVNVQLLEKGAASFTSKDASVGKSPLSEKLFDTEGVAGVMIGRNFVTLTKSEQGDWEKIYQSGMKIIKAHLQADEPVLTGDVGSAPQAHEAASGEIETKIKQILDDEIRPAVAMDGGDITFDKFEDGVVYLFLQGSCSGCPSSTLTLKMGIETRLKELIPDIREVVAI